MYQLIHPAVLGAILLAASSPTQACECSADYEAGAFERAQFVFLANVTQDAGMHDVACFGEATPRRVRQFLTSVDVVWKGEVGAIELLTVDEGSSCAFPIDAGQRLVVASSTPCSDGSILIHQCSGTFRAGDDPGSAWPVLNTVHRRPPATRTAPRAYRPIHDENVRVVMAVAATLTLLVTAGSAAALGRQARRRARALPHPIRYKEIR